jgi:UDP-N-acetylglucosamine 2-epimerase (non-hydrolysing)
MAAIRKGSCNTSHFLMRYMIIAGARPNFMKIAPIMEAFQAAPVILVHTGQHYDSSMSDGFFEDLGIPAPDVNLGVGSGSHAQQTARIMAAFEPVCLQHRPDWVIVVGDVNSTLACAITAKKLGIKVAHVEAGLRSGDMSMPEEINRLCTDCISDLLFTTDVIAGENLRREGVAPEKIHFVGNTMIDTLVRHIDRAVARPLPEGLCPGQFAILTLHRPGNVDGHERLSSILCAVAEVSKRFPVIFPAHPRTVARLTEFGLLSRLQSDSSDIRLVEPLSYLPFVGLVARARMVLTDSGGIQEETTVLGIPCITMRPNTERPITCEVGTNVLTGTDPVAIRKAAAAVLEGRTKPHSVPEKWDGKAAGRIVRVLIEAR